MRTIIILFCLLVGTPAFATSFNPYTYAVDGELSIVGNDVCTPSPCTERLTFSFLFQWQPFGFTELDRLLYAGWIVPGSSQTTSFGPLGSYTFYGEGDTQNNYYAAFGNHMGDEIDIFVYAAWTTETPWIGPAIGGAELFTCSTQICSTDFIPPSQQNGVPFPGIRIQGTGTTTAQRLDAVPEPMSLLLVGIGVVGLVMWRRVA